MKQVIHYLLFLHTSHTHQLLTHHPDFLHPSFFSHNHFLPCGEVVGFDKIPLRHNDQREHYTIQRLYFFFCSSQDSVQLHIILMAVNFVRMRIAQTQNRWLSVRI